MLVRPWVGSGLGLTRFILWGGLAAAGEAADGAASAALGVDEGAAAVRAADVAREGESQLGAYKLAHDRSPSVTELVC